MSVVYEFRGNAYRGLSELDVWTNLLTEAPLEPELPIVDAHHHLWDDERGRYLLEDYLKDVNSGHNIRASVFVEAGAMYRNYGDIPSRPIGEVEFVNGIAAMSASGHYGISKICAGIVGHADLALGDYVRPVLENLVLAGNGRFRGIRHNLSWDTGNATKFNKFQAPPHLLLDKNFRKGFSNLYPLGLSFDAWQFHPQLPELADLLSIFPDTSVILDHVGGLLGLSPHDFSRKDTFKIWQKSIENLSNFPNLSLKIGGLGMLYCNWDFHLRNKPPSSEELAAIWDPYIDVCLNAFGVDRCIMESNFPVDKQSCGYGVLWNALKRVTKNYSLSERTSLYHDNAVRFYRLEL